MRGDGAAGSGPGVTGLGSALEAQQERLRPCVHCGFCLPACPTYVRLGDEADSPRGRLHLMLAVVEGRLDPGSEAFRTHIDRCLGCRACEPACPSGVEYGTLLEHARQTSAEARPPGLLTRGLLTVMGSRPARALFLLGGRVLRATGMAGMVARALPRAHAFRSARLGLAMLDATRARRASEWRRVAPGSAGGPPGEPTASPVTEAPPAASARAAGAVAEPSPGQVASRGRVGLLTGCVQSGLYGRVNAATARVLGANGFDVVEVRGQDCCGALHAHAGALDGARRLARRNVEAFERAGLDHVVVNAAGCGASMKEYGTLLEHDSGFADRAAALSARVRDVSELLAEGNGPRRGAEVRCSVAYDHPCHLLHAQGVREAPLGMLAAVPGLEVRVVQDADECCGGAGIYGITHPDLGGRIGADKVAAVRAEEADVVATPNPGCMMQIGAGLLLEGATTPAVHPIELLDESYRRAGYYRS